jgi:hypothetical protein
MTQSKRAIIKIGRVERKGESLPLGYQRRIYSILRRYTPEVSEGAHGSCFAELTGLRTFFKMTYSEMILRITKDIKNEVGVTVKISAATAAELEGGRRSTKRAPSVSTYTEMNTLFRGSHFIPESKRGSSRLTKKVKLSVPFLGKVS